MGSKGIFRRKSHTAASSGSASNSSSTPASRRSSRRSSKLKCKVCEKPFIFKDQCVHLDGAHFHKSCLSCAVCKTSLTEEETFAFEGVPYCDRHHPELNPCAKCNTQIETEAIAACGLLFHAACLKCQHCQKPIKENSFVEEDDQQVSCKPCHNARLPENRKCAMCQDEATDEMIMVPDLGIMTHPKCFKCTTCSVSLIGLPYRTVNDIQCNDCYWKDICPICAGCKEHILPLPGEDVCRYLSLDDKEYHPECILCYTCSKPLQADGHDMYKHNGRYYCMRHAMAAQAKTWNAERRSRRTSQDAPTSPSSLTAMQAKPGTYSDEHLESKLSEPSTPISLSSNASSSTSRRGSFKSAAGSNGDEAHVHGVMADDDATPRPTPQMERKPSLPVPVEATLRTLEASIVGNDQGPDLTPDPSRRSSVLSTYNDDTDDNYTDNEGSVCSSVHQLPRRPLSDAGPNLQEWLKSAGHEEYMTNFTDKGFVSWDQLADATDLDLQDLGITNAQHRMQILRHFRRMSQPVKRRGSEWRPSFDNGMSPYRPPAPANSPVEPSSRKASRASDELMSRLFGLKGQQKEAESQAENAERRARL
eukprot:TRINITY_DN10844_c0_g2_i5.p1 TRINITY_DN10844_c0_g2~~TRINITY_DN10844_c0_g2_i5.p1  ORF type:complete len:590 (+),score=68.87 TRINITY_DN10844_c0_g2_i5:170-1939(+)